jgi:uncharacterized protein
MKSIAKHLSLLFLLTGIAYASCQQRNSNTQTGKFPNRDTMFVEYKVKDTDSLAKAINDSLRTGEFVSSAYTVRIPLIPTDYVNDYIHLFTQPQINTLDSIIINYEKKTTNQMAIITVDSQWIKKDSFKSFVLQLHNTWGVGQKDKNNGIVIAICPGHRIVRINNGYGIEKVFTDEQTHQIIQNIIIPAYKEEKYFEGTRNALIEITKRVPAIK